MSEKTEPQAPPYPEPKSRPCDVLLFRDGSAIEWPPKITITPAQEVEPRRFRVTIEVDYRSDRHDCAAVQEVISRVKGIEAWARDETIRLFEESCRSQFVGVRRDTGGT